MVSCGVDFFVVFKHKAAYEMRISDWSSDVCSSDLVPRLETVDVGEDAILVSEHGRPPTYSCRHAELVSASNSPQSTTSHEARWTLKQVQGDGGNRSSPSLPDQLFRAEIGPPRDREAQPEHDQPTRDLDHRAQPDDPQHPRTHSEHQVTAPPPTKTSISEKQ